MSAELESMFWLQDDGAPWHKLGTSIDGPVKSGEEAIKLAGLDWTVSTQQLFYWGVDTNTVINTEAEEEDQIHLKVLLPSNNFAVVRDSDNNHLGTVGPGWSPVQNVNAFSFMDKAVGEGEIEYRTAGSLKGGKVVWILASLPGYMKIGADDHVAKFLLLSNSHDGSMALRINITPIRVVCWNTLSGAISAAEQAEDAGKTAITRFWHTRGVHARLNDFSQELAKVRHIYDQTQEAYNYLAGKPVSTEDVETYISTLFPLAEDSERPTRTLNIREAVVKEFEGGYGSELKAARGTRWGLYNAVAAYTDHTRGRNADNRLYSAWFGASINLKEQALDLAMTM